jgi:G6PDH family F420-dependent oxidoreductase
MLEEAIEVIRLLWEGGVKSHRGRYYTVEDARLYSLPKVPPAIMVAANRPAAIDLAGRVGDALVTTDAKADVVEQFHAAGGKGKPCFTELSVCWAKSERKAIETAHEVWSLAALEGPLFTELALPAHFEAAFKMIGPEDVAEAVVCGPDPKRHVEALEKAMRAGFTDVLHSPDRRRAGFVHRVLPARGSARPRPEPRRA